MKNLLIISIIIFSFNNLYALNIDESIKSTIENNPKVKIAIEKINESKEIVVFANGSKLPTITSTLSGTYSNSDTETANVSSTPETFTDSYKITVTKNIYNFGISDLEIERSKICLLYTSPSPRD